MVNTHNWRHAFICDIFWTAQTSFVILKPFCALSCQLIVELLQAQLVLVHNDRSTEFWPVVSCFNC